VQSTKHRPSEQGAFEKISSEQNLGGEEERAMGVAGEAGEDPDGGGTGERGTTSGARGTGSPEKICSTVRVTSPK
jgi:hypothetical protein